MINGGSKTGNTEPGAEKTAAIWNPDTGRLTYTVDELNPRLYHSTSVLLADGTVLSTAGGFASSSQRNYLDAQIYKPPYLFDETGALADRPVIVGAPKTIEPGDTFTITVDDAASITKLTFAKTGASTHTLNMDARFTDLEFTRGPNNTLIVKIPENALDVTAGSWMLFAWNDKGVPSVAAMVAVQPTLPNYDGIGDMTAEYFAIPANAMTLDQVDVNAPAIHSERVTTISEYANGTFFPGGPADDFGVRFSGDFTVDKTGNYTFYLTADDGARLMIDGKLVTQTVGTVMPQNLTQTIALTAGEHKIELVYIEVGGLGQIDLDWSGPGFGRSNMTFDGADHNLVVNGGFEHNDPTGSVPFGWTKTGAGQMEQIPTGAASGRGYFSLGGSSPNHIVDGELSQLVEKRGALEEKLNRLELRAPVSGRVLNLLAHTVGGVIKPGDTLANIVPDKDPLVVEAFVSPREIDRIRDGMPARIRFTAFNSKTTPELNGTVVNISADHTLMAENAPPGFKVRVKLKDGETEQLGNHAMLPGMEAEVLFTSAERTVISYLAKPLTDQFARAFRER